MVTPLSSVLSGRRPEPALVGSARKRLNVENEKGFLSHLRRPSTEAKPEQLEAECGNLPHTRKDQDPHEIPAVEASPTGLAPEDASGRGPAPLDVAQWLSVINPTGDTSAAASTATTAPASPTDLSSLIERWVRRVALGGDQRRGVARLDIGQGRFAGAELLIVAEPGQVSVELNLPPEAAAPGLGERLRARLAQRGLTAEVIVR